MADYWVDGYDGLGRFPAIRTLLSGPDHQLSRGRPVTLLSGTAVAEYTDLSVLTDGWAQDAVRTVETTATFVVDLGVAAVLDYAAVINSNASSLRVRLSSSSSLAAPVVDVTFTPDLSRVGWVDLRGFAPSAVRYVGFTLTGPKAISVCELVAGLADEYDGALENVVVTLTDPREMARSEYGVSELVTSEAFTRHVALNFRILDAGEQAALIALFDASGQGLNFFFVPESRQPMALWIEWPEDWERTYGDIATLAVSGLTLHEETFSVL